MLNLDRISTQVVVSPVSLDCLNKKAINNATNAMNKITKKDFHKLSIFLSKGNSKKRVSGIRAKTVSKLLTQVLKTSDHNDWNKLAKLVNNITILEDILDTRLNRCFGINVKSAVKFAKKLILNLKVGEIVLLPISCRVDVDDNHFMTLEIKRVSEENVTLKNYNKGYYAENHFERKGKYQVFYEVENVPYIFFTRDEFLKIFFNFSFFDENHSVERFYKLLNMLKDDDSKVKVSNNPKDFSKGMIEKKCSLTALMLFLKSNLEFNSYMEFKNTLRMSINNKLIQNFNNK